MIYRKILKVKTKGSRQTRDLRPALSDRLPQGLNYAVLEYAEDDQSCIIEAWCSDHPLLKLEHQKKQKDLDDLTQDPDVIQALTAHSKSPAKLGSFSLSANPENKKDMMENSEAKTLKFKDITGSYVRKEKAKTTMGLEEDIYVLDEG